MKFEGKNDISIIKGISENNQIPVEIAQKNKLKPFCVLFSFFRSYITAFSVIFLLGLSLVANSASNNNSQKGSILFNYLDGKGGNEENELIVEKSIEETNDLQSVQNIPMVKIASADNSILMDSSLKAEEEDSISESVISQANNCTFFDGTSCLSSAVYYDDSLEDTKYGIIKYIVQDGDTASSIATSFGISTYTVLWANDLQTRDIIKIGRELEILPITGVKHIVEEGDTASSIATIYKADADEVIIFNDLPADGLFPDGSVGKVLIIPNGEKESPITIVVPTPRATNGQIVSSSKYQTSTFYNPLNSHSFAYGHCTYYVASRVYVPWSGHAKSWLANARAYGYRTGNTPVAGAIVATNESRLYGHVAYVESVNGDTITISEMNYVAWNRKSVRVLSINSSVIRGYIYMK